MKWVLLSSLLLMAISLYCFYYTIHTLYHQKRLAALKNDFVNNMTHELKTPVATIGVAAEAITDFDLDKASTQEYAHIIREQSSNLTKLIEHILESAMEEETAEMPMEPICIKLLVEKALLHIKPQTEKRKAIIESSFIENVYVQGNWIHLTNVIVNLLDNSLKYSEEKPLITITSRKEQNWVILQISDKGIGIEACYQDRVFDRFFRVPTGNIHTVKGYGLGLSYAKAIVEKHRGSVILESKKLSGTSITLKLPVYMYENV
jgi:signal transduction histidine kinase